jgi:4-hydroxybenzoate polyprenyltransferase
LKIATLSPAPEPHHGEEVMRLVGAERDSGVGAQVRGHKKPDLRSAICHRMPAMSRQSKRARPAAPRVADAPPDNWVDRHAPAWLVPYLRLSRVDRPVGTWLLLIPCWWGLALAVAADPAGLRLFDLWIAVGCAIGAFLMRGAGCTWNDLTDRDIDGAVARTRSRPLPSGQVTPRGALAGWWRRRSRPSRSC